MNQKLKNTWIETVVILLSVILMVVLSAYHTPAEEPVCCSTKVEASFDQKVVDFFMDEKPN